MGPSDTTMTKIARQNRDTPPEICRPMFRHKDSDTDINSRSVSSLYCALIGDYRFAECFVGGSVGVSGLIVGVRVVAMTECHSCGYEWEYSGEMVYATCPSCMSKVDTSEESGA